MIRLMAGAPIVFVAYSSRDIVLAQLIADAVYVANGKSDRLRYETWVNNDVPGNPLISPVLDRIEDSAFVIADITTLNLSSRRHTSALSCSSTRCAGSTLPGTTIRPATRRWPL
jgi:hypothetical protein